MSHSTLEPEAPSAKAGPVHVYDLETGELKRVEEPYTLDELKRIIRKQKAPKRRVIIEVEPDD